MYRFRYDQSQYAKIEGQAESGQNCFHGIAGHQIARHRLQGGVEQIHVRAPRPEQERGMVQAEEQEVPRLNSAAIDQC